MMHTSSLSSFRLTVTVATRTSLIASVIAVALTSSSCASQNARERLLASAGEVRGELRINAKTLVMKYVYALHRAAKPGDEKRVERGSNDPQPMGEIGFVVFTDHKLAVGQLDQILAGGYPGSSKIHGFVLAFEFTKPDNPRTTFLNESGAQYLYGASSYGAKIAVLADSVSGGAMLQNQDGSGTHGYEVSFRAPWMKPY
jgi:hypothetical protein